MSDLKNLKNLNNKKIRLQCFFLAAVFGLFHIFLVNFSMTSDSSDGISYLDIADAYLNLNWNSVINALWSPLYPLFIAIAFFIFKPDYTDELSILHLANFMVFIFALFCFDYFMKELLQFHKNKTKKLSDDFSLIPEWAIIFFGYSLFIFASIHIIALRGAGPDTLVSAIVYLASGVLLHLNNNPDSNRFIYFIFGFILALGYLTKNPMFIFSILYLTLLFFTLKNNKQIFNNILISILGFLILSIPFISALSLKEGHLTIGESPRLNYAWYINDVTLFVHWQGEESGNGTPMHSTRKIFNSPPLYEFAKPVGGTYPPWFDPAYWYKGVKIKFNLIKNLSAIASNLNIFYLIFFKYLGFVTIGLLVLIFMSNSKSWLIELLIPSIFMFSMYLPVHLEPRYIGAFVTIFILGIYLSVQLPKNNLSEKLMKSITVFMSIMILATSAILISKDISDCKFSSSENHEIKTVKSLKEFGIKEGDNIGIIGYSIPDLPYWARLAKVKIIAEILSKDTDIFWSLSKDKKYQIISLFKNTGAKIIIAKGIPVCCSKNNWHKIADTNNYIYHLKH